MRDRKRNSLLWEISGGNTPGISYLFGTMHVKDQRAFSRRQLVYECINTSEVFYTEISLDDAMEGDFSFFQLPPNQPLDKLLSEKKYQKLRGILLKSVQLDLNFFRNLKPVVISNLIDERILQNSMPEALDRHLWNFAQSQGKPCFGIESVNEQVELLRKIPLEQQLKGLLHMGKQISTHRRRTRAMAEAYQEGDIYKIYQMARRGMGKIRHAMVFERNERMTSRLAERLENECLFFAVGAGHLAGGKGIIRLLKQHGYRLRPVG